MSGAIENDGERLPSVDAKSGGRTIEAEDFGKMIQRMIRALGRRVGDDDPESLALFGDLRAAVDRAEHEAMAAQLAAGFTFRHLSRGLGQTHSAAHNRFTRYARDVA